MKFLKNYSVFLESLEQDTEDMYLPTYEECLEIVSSNPDMYFYETKTEIGQYKISMFNYMLAPWQNFKTPIPGKPHMTADELRGLCFVFNPDGTLFKRYLLMNKFWNINQIPDSMYHVIQDYKILNVMDKVDGSITSFIRVPDGRVFAKSKMSLISDQAVAANKIYQENKDINRFVNWCLDEDIVAIFEYVSPRNKIVLDYENDDLILLRMRDNKTGEYLDPGDYWDLLGGINIAKFEDETTLDDLIELSKTITNREGWVIGFTNGKMVKLKGDWYMQRHRLFTSLLNRENDVIDLILDEKMDDVIAQLTDADQSKRDFIDGIIEIVNKYISNTYTNVQDMLRNYDGSKKDFALKYNGVPFFSICMSVINRNEDIISLIKDDLRRKTKDLNQARKWVENNSK